VTAGFANFGANPGGGSLCNDAGLALTQASGCARRLQESADLAWKSAGTSRLTLHDCRHAIASLMIAANVNAKAL